MNRIFSLLALIALLQLAPSCTEQTSNGSPDNSLLVATLYHQHSAERDALCYQAYNIAHDRLDEILEKNAGDTALAIVLDLDETVLDNSPYEAQTIKGNYTYPTGWDEWMHAAAATAIPGAVEFLQYAAEQGIEIFYITNRKEKYRQATLENLQKLGIAPATGNHLLLRTDVSTKEPRRQEVLKNHRIIMLFGDNLADFSSVFDGEKSTAQRAALVDSLQQAFGKRYIVFPNAMYGDWLNAAIDFRYELSQQEKIELQKNRLEGF
ncbi:MAG: 5'-nucleotidase, lipoprotein e(P4) family [Bacteroidales bacterium]